MLKTCPICDLTYDADYDKRLHSRKCSAFKKALRQFGTINPYAVREEIKHKSWYILGNKSTTLQQALHASLAILRAHFDRSVQDAIDTKTVKDHPSFSEYIAMRLNHKKWCSTYFSYPNLYQTLVSIYGKKEGIPEEGYTYWHKKK